VSISEDLTDLAINLGNVGYLNAEQVILNAKLTILELKRKNAVLHKDNLGIIKWNEDLHKRLHELNSEIKRMIEGE